MIIPEEIIDTQSFIYNDEDFDVRQGFAAGVAFAEEYLKNLAVEFGEYITEYNSTPHLNRIEDTQELFEIFIKEKYDTKTEITER